MSDETRPAHFFDLYKRAHPESVAAPDAIADLDGLRGTTSLSDAAVKTVCGHILALITRITKSAYGFFGFVSEDESVMIIHSWSGRVMQDCSMVARPRNFPVCEAGVWGEAIRGRTPLILNNYPAAREGKKGLPAGHVLLCNLLVVPIFSCGRITSVVAVANRLSDYSQEDVDQLTSFFAGIQAIIDEKRAESLAEWPGSLPGPGG
jgi:putative methionine-R-sulfoxide reductase with GAF domain